MDFFRRFMAGRYGSDPLNNALLILGIALIIVARILGWAWMNVFILALLCLCYFRMFSRNIQARYAENEKFMRWWRPVSNRIRGAQGRFADRKTHCYFKCPECGQRASRRGKPIAFLSVRGASKRCACPRARERL